MKPNEMHRRMKTQYGDACLSLQQVYERDRKFKNGVSCVADAHHPGRIYTAYRPDRVENVERVTRENRRVTTDQVALELGISHGSARHIMQDVLQYHKVCAEWVPRQLKPELKEWRMGACKEILGRYQTEGDAFLQRIIIDDESWAHYSQPETKTASKDGRYPNLPNSNKFRARPSAAKVMLTLFWESNGLILEHYMSKGTTVTSSSYCDLLVNHLKSAIRCMRCGLLATGVVRLHDNARLHTAHTTVTKIKDLHYERLPHQVLHLQMFTCLGVLKEELSGRNFRCGKEVQEDVHDWLHKQQKEFFFPRGIQALVKRWNKCTERSEVYVEKYYSCNSKTG